MEIYDISGPLQKGMWDYGKPYIPYDSNCIATIEKNGYIARELKITTHTGTHVECGGHWWSNATPINEYGLERFYGEAIVLNLECKCVPFGEIDVSDLVEAGAGSLKEGDICILKTGWDVNWFDEKYVSQTPFITVDSAKYLVGKKIKLLGTDFSVCGDPRDGIDFVPEGLELPDHILSYADIPYVLGLANLNNIPEIVYFAAFPLKIYGGDGSPVRAVAWNK